MVSIATPLITNLISDIYAEIDAHGMPDFTFSKDRENSPREPGLRLSKMGKECPCALWHSVHKPELAEKLPAWVKIKFSYGNMLEALVITLAKAAGHTVTGEQDEVTVDGISGHRDCVIDGCIVDVKSASSPSFKTIREGKNLDQDIFISSYLDQLDGYLLGSMDDPLVSVKDRAYLLAIDKQLGHMCLYEHYLRTDNIRSRIAEHKRIVNLPKPPLCTCGTEPDGKSGNLSLDTKASYSAFKYCCFPNLRTFLYSKGPVYLTKVVRLPDVPELDRNGNIKYN